MVLFEMCMRLEYLEAVIARGGTEPPPAASLSAPVVVRTSYIAVRDTTLRTRSQTKHALMCFLIPPLAAPYRAHQSSNTRIIYHSH